MPDGTDRIERFTGRTALADGQRALDRDLNVENWTGPHEVEPMRPPGDPWWEGLHRPSIVGATLVNKTWTRPKGDASYDYDHCEFCFVKFSDTAPGALREGYATSDDAMWVCADCFDNPDLRTYFSLQGANE
jgi:hypothetical protein